MQSLALFDFSKKINYKNELLAGLTVAMTMIPESLSFAILAGLSPLMGLYAAFMMDWLPQFSVDVPEWFPEEQELQL